MGQSCSRPCRRQNCHSVVGTDSEPAIRVKTAWHVAWSCRLFVERQRRECARERDEVLGDALIICRVTAKRDDKLRAGAGFGRRRSAAISTRAGWRSNKTASTARRRRGGQPLSPSPSQTIRSTACLPLCLPALPRRSICPRGHGNLPVWSGSRSFLIGCGSLGASVQGGRCEAS
jgi:hypothetical protein